MNAEKLKERYNQIWDKHEETASEMNELNIFQKILKRGFTFQHDQDILQPDVLFIGINPAFKEGGDSIKNWYNQKQSLSIPYFKIFQTIEKSLLEDYKRPIIWTHIDLMVFKETDQKFIETHLFNNDNGLDFIMAQLKIAKERIEHIQPKVIVVSNALARRLMGKDRTADGKHNVWMDFKFKFDPAMGTDKIIESSLLPNTYVFFTSMLSGQRALDNGSRERLIWHINEIFNRNKQN